MSLMGCDIYGQQKLLAKFEGMAARAAARPMRSLVLGGLLIEGRAKVYCPVDTGFLMGTIDVQPGVPDSDTVSIGPHAEYAAFVEFGTSRSRAQPYMRPALDESRDEIARLVGAEIMAEISTVLPGV